MNIYNEFMSLVDLFFPKFCLNCFFPGAYICHRCQKYLWSPKESRCFLCKKQHNFGLTHQTCLKNFNIDGVDYIFNYNHLLKKIIKSTKYRLATQVWQELTLNIKPGTFDRLAFYKKLSGRVFYQPIPLSKDKFRERGFNQALLITKFLKKIINFPIADFLLRVKNTKSQAELLTENERRSNLKNAFKINRFQKLIKGSKIILIDDVITTGSTVKEAAKVLKKAGAEKIYVLAIAKG